MAVKVESLPVDNEGELVDVQLWVSRDGSTEIKIDTECTLAFGFEVAMDISKAINSLVEWADTSHGRRKIAEHRKKA